MKFGDKLTIIVNESKNYPAFDDIYLSKGIYDGIVISEDSDKGIATIRWLDNKVVNTIEYLYKEPPLYNCIKDYSIWIGLTKTCRFMAYQLDSNFEMTVCFCNNRRNPSTEYEGNCNELNCPLRHDKKEIQEICRFYEKYDCIRNFSSVS